MTRRERLDDTLMEVIGAAIESELAGNGVEQNEAERIAVATCLAIQRDIGGTQVYIQKAGVSSSKRDREIVAAFHDGNYFELSKRFGLSERRIRQIINNDTAARREVNPIGWLRR